MNRYEQQPSPMGQNDVVTLKSMTERQSDIFQHLVDNNDSKLTILVHPFCPIDPIFHRYHDPNRSVLKNYRQNLSHLLHGDGPLMILEETSKIDSLKFKLIQTKKFVSVVPTFPASPDPILTTSPSATLYARGLEWNKLIKQLKDFGVDKISLGGMFFHQEDGLDNPQGCVGSAAEKLSKHFELDFLYGVCYPDQSVPGIQSP